MKAFAQYTISEIHDGADTLSIEVGDGGGALRARVYRGAKELSAAEIAALGRLNWFRENAALPSAEGQSPEAVGKDSAWNVALERYDEPLSGSSVTFEDAEGGRALRSLSVAIEPVQSGSGTPSPENVRPISGRTGVTLSQSGADVSEVETLTLSWADEAGTVYGGTLDVASGELTVDRVYALLNDPDLWVSYSGNAAHYQYAYRFRNRKPGSRSLAACSAFDCVYSSSKPLMLLWLNSASSGYIGIVDSGGVLTLSDIQEMASSNEIAIVYELASPVTYRLTPQEVTTLLGTNIIRADTGDVTLIPGYETLARGSYRPVQKLHIKYSNDGESFTAMDGEVLGSWIGTLVDFSEQASTVFSDYSWKRFSDDTELRREVTEYTDRKIESLQSVYLAKSDFGSFSERINSQIEQTARGVVESYGYESLIEGVASRADETERFLSEMNGQIRRGVIEDPETGELHFGIAISENLVFTGQTQELGGKTYYRLAPGQTLGLYTSLGWQFWINGVKCGWFSSADSMLHVSNSVIESTLRLGADWAISTQGGFGLRYTGG